MSLAPLPGLLALASAAAMALLLLGVPALAQVEVSLDPAMTKGPAGAPVTILEVSDYQ